jgi:hypothetical protein
VECSQSLQAIDYQTLKATPSLLAVDQPLGIGYYWLP